MFKVRINELMLDGIAPGTLQIATIISGMSFGSNYCFEHFDLLAYDGF